METTEQAKTKVKVKGNGEQPVASTPTGQSAKKNPGKHADESKAQRFRRLAMRRVQKSIERLRQIVPLANRAAYDYSTDDAEKIVYALAEEVQRIKLAFTGQSQARPTFQL